jgi:transcriptional regulator with XRE-family HTH domain
LRDHPGMNTSPLTANDDSRHALGRFLRARREATPPAAASLAAVSTRRRTPGLRREEVAQLADISTTWYTWLEQGREISLSGAALARLAEVFRLSPAERSYLFELARRHDPVPPAVPGDQAVPRELRDAVLALPMPAYLLDRAWRLCAWNPAAADLFSPWLASGEACLLRFVFLDPMARGFICDWAVRARRLVAEFRADTALYPDDAGLLALVAGLRQASTAFDDYWGRHDVLAREGGRRAFEHPGHGRVVHDQVTLVPTGSPDHKLVLLMPASDDGAGRDERY